MQLCRTQSQQANRPTRQPTNRPTCQQEVCKTRRATRPAQLTLSQLGWKWQWQCQQAGTNRWVGRAEDSALAGEDWEKVLLCLHSTYPLQSGSKQCRRAAVFAASVLCVAQSCLTLFSHRPALWLLQFSFRFSTEPVFCLLLTFVLILILMLPDFWDRVCLAIFCFLCRFPFALYDCNWMHKRSASCAVLIYWLFPPIQPILCLAFRFPHPNHSYSNPRIRA